MALRNVLLATAALFVSTAAFAGDNTVGKGGETPAVAVHSTAKGDHAGKHHGKHHMKKDVKKEETKEEVSK